MRIIVLLSFIITALLITSCSNDSFYVKNYDFDNNEWAVKDSLLFQFNIEDTSQSHNMFIQIRNTPQYFYSNLYLFLKIVAPNGKFSKDTVECVLADGKGKWLGKPSAGLIDNQVLYKKNIRFPVTGTYNVIYTQAMRTESVKGITSIGYRLVTLEDVKK